MPNKKINQLDVRVAVATDLMLVGDPTTGTAYKSTVSTLPLVPTSRTLTINGVAFDLSPNRAWTIGTVTSVGLSMPSAFSVANSPITSSGTLAVTGAGTTLQYIDGTGALQTLPTRLESDSLVATVRNQSGATMTKGTIVYISGATGNKPLISKALATGDSTSAQTLGLLQTDIANNADGHIVVIGNLTDINTSGIAEGTQLYLSGTTAGTWTTTKPYAPIHLVYVGIVIREHINFGIISVKVQNGFEMDEIHNVSAQSPANNDGLFWNSTTNLWSKNTIGGVLGYTPQASLTLTTTGTSGAATLVGATLNIPQYSGGGGMAIGGAITSATAGSVLFAGASGVLAQDNANLFWDDANNRLGIGTATPTRALDITSDILVNGLTIGTGGSTTTIPNLAFGNGALNSTTTGIGQNTAIGFISMSSLTTGSVNTAIGYRTLNALTTGTNNVAIGVDVLRVTTASSNNVGIGNKALTALTTSSGSNVAIGFTSSQTMTTGSSNVAIGATTLGAATTGSSNTAVGYQAMDGLTTGIQNTAIGNESLGGGSFNGSNNIGIGHAAGGSLTSASDNFIAGSNAMVFQTTGGSNVAIGTDAGRRISGGGNNTITNTSIFIGQDTRPLAISQTNQIVIGNSAIGLGSNTTVIGNSSTTDAAIYGRLLVNYSAPVIGTHALDVNGTARVVSNLTSSQYRLSALNTAPATASSTGTLGEIRIDASYIYVCTATNTWVRSALTTW
jgi:hypothetical protein